MPGVVNNLARILAVLAVALCPLFAAADELSTEKLEGIVGELLKTRDRVESIRFSSLIRAATGNEVLPFRPDEAEADRRIFEGIAGATREMLAELADPAHPVHEIGRINEVSNSLEDILMEKIEAVPGLSCESPATASGVIQRSGYPDLIIRDCATGRVAYLDLKVFREGSERSTFRTFYYEPRPATNKINDTGSHLILGLPHAGRSEAGLWTFTGWNIADLYHFRVRLKVEFQASNRDLYSEDTLIFRETLGN